LKEKPALTNTDIETRDFSSENPCYDTHSLILRESGKIRRTIIITLYAFSP